MVSIFDKSGSWPHLDDSFESFSVEAINIKKNNKDDLEDLLLKLSGLLLDKAKKGDIFRIEKTDFIINLLKDISYLYKIDAYVGTWFIIEICCYSQDDDWIYQFMNEKIYLAPPDAISSFTALIKNYDIIPVRTTMLLISYFIQQIEPQDIFRALKFVYKDH